MKYTVMLLLACLVGSAAATGYTMTQSTFLMGENPVTSSMEDSNFEDYADLYWSSYISNPDVTPTTTTTYGQAIDVENTLFFWMTNFPFDVSESSFGNGANQTAGTVSPRYDFAAVSTWLYDSPMPIGSSSFEQESLTNTSQVQKNTQFLNQEIVKNFGL